MEGDKDTLDLEDALEEAQEENSFLEEQIEEKDSEISLLKKQVYSLTEQKKKIHSSSTFIRR